MYNTNKSPFKSYRPNFSSTSKDKRDDLSSFRGRSTSPIYLDNSLDRSKLHYKYNNKSRESSVKSSNYSKPIEEDIILLKKEVERLKYDNFYLKEELKKQNPNFYSSKFQSSFTPSLNSNNEKHETEIFDSNESKCLKLFNKLQEMLSAKSHDETYDKIVQKLNDKKIMKIEEFFKKVSDLHTQINEEVNKKYRHNYNKEDNTSTYTTKSKHNKNNIQENLKTYNTHYIDEITNNIKTIWRWIKSVVQLAYFSPNNNDFLHDIKKCYNMRSIEDVKQMILDLLKGYDKTKSRVNKIKEILNTQPIKSRSISKGKARLN